MAQLVSIIIPIYNSESYIGETISSCLSQVYRNIEILLIDDGSTDSSENVIREFDDVRIRYFKLKNGGPCAARNFGIQQANGTLFQFLDHDDVIDALKIFSQVDLFNKYGDEYIYSGKMGTVSGSKRTTDEGYELYQRDFSPQQYFETMLNQFGKYITTGSWLVPARLVRATSGWDSLAGLNDDGEYFMRIILSSKGIKFSKESIFFFRRDVPDSLSKQFGSKVIYEKWLYSYKSYVANFINHFENKVAKRLGRKALSIYYCNSYPKYPDLLENCEKEIQKLGFRGPSAHGGTRLKFAASLIGVKFALRLLFFKQAFYKGVKP